MILDTNAVSALADGDPAFLKATINVTRFSLPALQHQMPVLTRDEHFSMVEGLERCVW